MSGGLIGIIAQETGRYNMFPASLTSTEAPEDTSVKWWFGHSIASNCNGLVHEMYRQDKEWLWLLGDDHTWSPGLLTKLLAHEKDVTVPICLMRAPPYRPTIFSDWENEDEFRRRHVELNDHPDGGLIPVHSAGSGGC